MTAIGCMGDPARSCALLAGLLVVADDDPVAGHGVLVALIPGLQAVAGRRWASAERDGVWRTRDELDADCITAAWHAIHAHAGQRHARPARIIVRQVERRLRTIHDAHLRTVRRTVSLNETAEIPLADPEGGTAGIEEAARCLVDAMRSGRLDATTAGLAYRVAVLDRSVADAGRQLGLGRRRTRRSLLDAYRVLAGDAGASRSKTAPVHHPSLPGWAHAVSAPGTAERGDPL
ncbi:MAG: hypothetical protein ACRDZY_04070 [Acidimicrobiales bacterium]